MIGVARDERYKRPPTWRRTPWVRCLLTCTPGTRPKRCIVCSMSQMSPRLALLQPHLHQTREQALSSPVVLLAQDTTDSDLSHRRTISGVGHIGNERGRGFFVQTGLAVRTRDTRSPRVHGPGTVCAHFRSKGENNGTGGASGKSAKPTFGYARGMP